jgi:hypothetical protein
MGQSFYLGLYEIFNDYAHDLKLPNDELLIWILVVILLGINEKQYLIDKLQCIFRKGPFLIGRKFMSSKMFEQILLVIFGHLEQIFLKDVLSTCFRECLSFIGIKEVKLMRDVYVSLFDLASKEQIGELDCQGGQGS